MRESQRTSVHCARILCLPEMNIPLAAAVRRFCRILKQAHFTTARYDRWPALSVLPWLYGGIIGLRHSLEGDVLGNN